MNRATRAGTLEASAQPLRAGAFAALRLGVCTSARARRIWRHDLRCRRVHRPHPVLRREDESISWQHPRISRSGGGDGVPRIAYRAEHSREWASARRVTEAEHRLASREGGAWKIEPVATGGAAHAFAIAGDTLQIAFATTTRGNVSLATRSM